MKDNEPEWAERSVSEDLETVLDEVKWVCKNTQQNSEDMEMLADIHEEVKEKASENSHGEALEDFGELEELIDSLNPFLRTLEYAVKRINESIEGLEQDLRENKDVITDITDDHISS